MLIQTLKILLDRDLKKLALEIGSYRSETVLWHHEKGIANSGGNLALHLVGNLNAFIHNQFGGGTFVRDRDSEFSLKGIPKEELVRRIEETRVRVLAALDNVTDADLAKEYPILVFKEKTSVEYMLVHLATHLGYHLGQVNYHRRLLDV